MLNEAKKIDNIITYNKEIHEMSRGRSANTNINNEIDRIKEEITEIKELIKDNKENQKKDNQVTLVNYVSIIGGIIGILTLTIGAVVGVVIPINSNEKDIEYVKKFIEDIDEDIAKLTKSVDNLGKIVYGNTVYSASYTPKDELAKKVEFLDGHEPEIEYVDNGPALKDGEFVPYVYVEDGITDETNPNLYNTKIITAYTEGENEIYFLGQYNPNNQWYGTCILNIYKDNRLSCIFEAIYNDGKLYSYRRVSNEGDGTWEVADRVNKGGYRTGETWVYANTIDYNQEISLDKYEESQILTFDYFISSTRERLLRYYNGETSNGYYNDDSGKAYLIKYKDDGDIDYLYVGKMKKGVENDDTGDAWCIGWGYTNDGYHYYKGKFSDGKRSEKTDDDWIEPMTQEKIDSVVNPDDFNCSLQGLISEDT